MEYTVFTVHKIEALPQCSGDQPVDLQLLALQLKKILPVSHPHRDQPSCQDHAEFRPASKLPPMELSKSAIDKRMRRVMAPRADGSYLVPQEIRDQYRDPLERDSVRAMFEKCGYEPVGFLKMFPLVL